MQRSEPLNVLVSEPASFNRMPFLPYLWAVLKSSWERTASTPEQVRWLDPIFLKSDPRELLAPFRDLRLDVLALSSYTWNWDLQCALAELAKVLSPDCFVVAGGPHPDYKNPDFFREHPYIDAVAIKDGEITFSKILAKLLNADRDLSDVAGLYLPGNGGDGHRFTGPPGVPIVFDHSPYLDQSDFFESLIERFGTETFDVVWETNRGCPYSCNFCDWGSNTMSKVRRFDMERVASEIEWFSRVKIKSILLADANFGILPRDLEIADLLNDFKSRTGFPRFIHYSPAKNNPDRTVAIAKKFVASGISPVHTFAIQHTDPEVLAVADRANISLDKQREVARAVVDSGVPTLVQLIVGIPGDTYDLWKTCLTDLMDWGLHDNTQIFNYALLPNAPASDRAFLEEWEVETVSRLIPREGTNWREKDDVDALTRVDIVVECKTFSREDWIRMKVYAAFTRALHNRSLTRYLAMYLHFGHGISYRESYDALIERCFGGSELERHLVDHFETFLENEDGIEDLPFEELGETPLYFEASRWLFVRICWEFERYFERIRGALLQAFPHVDNLDSAVDYQRNLVILPSYDCRAGKSFSTELDWVSYFEQAQRCNRHESLGEPAPAPGGRVIAADSGDSLDWARNDRNGRWHSWIDYTRDLQRTLSVTFQDVRLRRSTALPETLASRGR